MNKRNGKWQEASGNGVAATLVTTLQKYVFGLISDGQQCCPPELVPNNVGWLKKIHDSLSPSSGGEGALH